MAGVIERRGGSRAAPRHRKGRAVLRPPSRDSVPPVLPTPPLDGEKFSYVRRHIWVLTLFSALSFPPLVYSQIRMVENSQLVRRLRAVRAVRHFLLPAVPDRGRDEPQLRPGRAQAHRGRLGAPALPVGGHLPAGLRRADRGTPQRLVPRGRAAQPLPRPGHPLRARRLGQPGAEGHGPPVRLRLRDPPGPGLVQEVRATCASGSRSPRASTSCCSTPTSPRARTCSTRPCPTWTRSRRRHRPDAAVLPRPRSADLGRARRRRHSGTLLPVHSDRPGQERRRDLRRQLRGLPACGAGAQRRDVPRGALRGPVDRLRPAPAGVAAALPAGRAVHRQLPRQHPGVPEPAVPLVLGHHEPAESTGSSGRPSCRCTPGCAT